MRMLRSFVAASVGLCATSALAGTFPSPPLYPSFSSAKEQIITIDPPGALASYAVALNHKGEVAGYYVDQNASYRGFIRKANGTFLSFGAGKEKFSVSDMNESGDVTGQSGSHGFLRKADGTIIKFDPPNSKRTEPYAINNNGEIAGTFFNKKNAVRGFLRASSGTITVVDYPGSHCGSPNGGGGAYVYDINSAGTAVGEECTGGVGYAFVRDATGHFMTIAPPDPPTALRLRSTRAALSSGSSKTATNSRIALFAIRADRSRS
jgi:uncharacterized membrane protein